MEREEREIERERGERIVNSDQVETLWILSMILWDESRRQRSQRASVLRNTLIFYVVWFNTTRMNCKAYLNYTCLVLHTVAFAHISREFATPLETILNILLVFHKLEGTAFHRNSFQNLWIECSTILTVLFRVGLSVEVLMCSGSQNLFCSITHCCSFELKIL